MSSPLNIFSMKSLFFFFTFFNTLVWGDVKLERTKMLVNDEFNKTVRKTSPLT